jgi:hypothetical protein
MKTTTSTIVELANMVARYRSAIRGYKRAVVEQAKIIQELERQVKIYDLEYESLRRSINRMRAVMPATLRIQFDRVVLARNTQ